MIYFFFKLCTLITKSTSIDVEVALVPLNRSVTENETFSVCVNITAGQLGCNITVPLVVHNGTALGEVCTHILY